MKRTPLVRKTRLKVKGRSRFRREVDPRFIDWVKRQPCLVNNGACWPEHWYRDAAHVRTRGAGGGWIGNLVSLCHGHHVEQHTIGIKSFQAKYHVDLKAEAARLATEWEGHDALG